MEDQLLQAYYWLSSAIAQAFAALVGLTAIFYIWEKNFLRRSFREVEKGLEKERNLERKKFRKNFLKFLKEQHEKLDSGALISIILSAVTVASALILLNLGSILPSNACAYWAMGIETGFALVALALIIIFVIKTLGIHPKKRTTKNKSQADEKQG